MSSDFSFSVESAHELCKAHRKKNGVRVFSQCWGCVKYSKDAPEKMCFFNPPNNDACKHVNKMFELSKLSWEDIASNKAYQSVNRQVAIVSGNSPIGRTIDAVKTSTYLHFLVFKRFAGNLQKRISLRFRWPCSLRRSFYWKGDVSQVLRDVQWN